MAEFQEMVRELHRLCETQRRLHENTCNKCPIKIATMGTIFQCYRYVLEKPKEAENIIMSWAAEHPEPVYPTWGEWLMQLGVMGRTSREMSNPYYAEAKAASPIPADIAQKLGIEPKEG